MNKIKNVHLLSDIDENGIKKMELAAIAHLRNSGITFKIVENSDKEVVIQVRQEKHSAGNYHSKKRLIEIVHETYDRFFHGKKIKVGALPFQESPVSAVDADWINRKMLATGTRVKDIANETGINRPWISTLLGGDEPLSQPMKALFWYYFKDKESQIRSEKKAVLTRSPRK